MASELRKSYNASNVLESGYSFFGSSKLVSINFYPITQKCYVHIRNRRTDKTVTLSLDEFKLLMELKDSIADIGEELIAEHANSSSEEEPDVPFFQPDVSPSKALKTDEGKEKSELPKPKRKPMKKRKNPFIDDEAIESDD